MISLGKISGRGVISPPLGIPKLQHLQCTADTPKLRRGQFRHLPSRRQFPSWWGSSTEGGWKAPGNTPRLHV